MYYGSFNSSEVHYLVVSDATVSLDVGTDCNHRLTGAWTRCWQKSMLWQLASMMDSTDRQSDRYC